MNRKCGILLHISEFYGKDAIGTIGKNSYQIIDWLDMAGFKYLQILPLNPTGYGDSPYSSFSAFAGNPYFIDLDELVIDNELDKSLVKNYFENISSHLRVDYGYIATKKIQLLKKAFNNIKSSLLSNKSFNKFISENKFWIDDFSMFLSLSDHYKGKCWNEWDKNFRYRTFDDKDLTDEIKNDDLFYKYLQWKFYSQWDKFKKYANSKNIKIIGDAPIFVAYNSSDVWANQNLFKLDDSGKSLFEAGVPPDYFSKTGQLWGNPLYNWDKHIETDFSWWINRVNYLLKSCDIVRIDHFRGFEACWEVPAGEKTAENGSWVKSKGWEFFTKLSEIYGENIPIIAEDLGIITEEVEELRDAFELPGMKIFEFCPWNDLKKLSKAPYLPVNYEENCVAYTGTHDNEPVVSWYNSLVEEEKNNIRNYLGVTDDNEIHWKIIGNILNSRANTVIFPIQDILGLGNESRLNVPGSTDNKNWSWRIQKNMLNSNIQNKILKLIDESQRRK